MLGPGLVVAHVPAGVKPPRQTPLYHPTSWQENEAFCPFGPAHSLDRQVEEALGPVDQCSRVDGIGPDDGSLANLTVVALDRLEVLVRNRLKRLQYRPDTLNGFIAGTSLDLDTLLDRAREERVELGSEVSHLLAGSMHGGGLEVPLLRRRPIVDAPRQVNVAA